MTPLFALATLLLWLGATLVLGSLRRMQRTDLLTRIAPYLDGAGATGDGRADARSMIGVIAPLAQTAGDAIGRLFGAGDDTVHRLARIGDPAGLPAFRTRQALAAVCTFTGISLVVAVLAMPAAPAAILILGGPTLAVLLLEQQLANAARDRQRRVFIELPVVAEQLGMLLSSGYSLGSACNRIAGRGSGVVAEDLTTVGRRVRQGLSEIDALREWAEVADVAVLHRLVGVLALDREAADIGRLIGDEARAARADAHRELLESIERRSQQVWIPVTVATLVPGLLFLCVPFIEALRLFTAG